jgi:hypothetical protein
MGGFSCWFLLTMEGRKFLTADGHRWTQMTELLAGVYPADCADWFL